MGKANACPQFTMTVERRRERSFPPCHFPPVQHFQFGNAAVGAAEPAAKLAVDILHHHHIGLDIGLVARVELSGRELVQHGRALGDDGGRSVLHFDQRHFAEEIAGLETCHVDDALRIRAPAHHQLAGVNDEHRAPWLAFRHHRGTGVEAALDQHGDQEFEACIRKATEERRGEQERFQIGRADSHRRNIRALPMAASGARGV